MEKTNLLFNTQPHDGTNVGVVSYPQMKPIHQRPLRELFIEIRSLNLVNEQDCYGLSIVFNQLNKLCLDYATLEDLNNSDSDQKTKQELLAVICLVFIEHRRFLVLKYHQHLLLENQTPFELFKMVMDNLKPDNLPEYLKEVGYIYLTKYICKVNPVEIQKMPEYGAKDFVYNYYSVARGETDLQTFCYTSVVTGHTTFGKLFVHLSEQNLHPAILFGLIKRFGHVKLNPDELACLLWLCTRSKENLEIICKSQWMVAETITICEYLKNAADSDDGIDQSIQRWYFDNDHPAIDMSSVKTINEAIGRVMVAFIQSALINSNVHLCKLSDLVKFLRDSNNVLSTSSYVVVIRGIILNFNSFFIKEMSCLSDPVILELSKIATVLNMPVTSLVPMEIRLAIKANPTSFCRMPPSIYFLKFLDEVSLETKEAFHPPSTWKNSLSLKVVEAELPSLYQRIPFKEKLYWWLKNKLFGI